MGKKRADKRQRQARKETSKTYSSYVKVISGTYNAQSPDIFTVKLQAKSNFVLDGDKLVVKQGKDIKPLSDKLKAKQDKQKRIAELNTAHHKQQAIKYEVKSKIRRAKAGTTVKGGNKSSVYSEFNRKGDKLANITKDEIVTVKYKTTANKKTAVYNPELKFDKTQATLKLNKVKSSVNREIIIEEFVTAHKPTDYSTWNFSSPKGN